ncbi:hypothetical protein HPB50_028085 [Hyalomma asiaticum]|nr:hypothetical protein HPB50_028085 [Hyalomma asiaticum]
MKTHEEVEEEAQRDVVLLRSSVHGIEKEANENLLDKMNGLARAFELPELSDSDLDSLHRLPPRAAFENDLVDIEVDGEQVEWALGETAAKAATTVSTIFGPRLRCHPHLLQRQPGATEARTEALPLQCARRHRGEREGPAQGPAHAAELTKRERKKQEDYARLRLFYPRLQLPKHRASRRLGEQRPPCGMPQLLHFVSMVANIFARSKGLRNDPCLLQYRGRTSRSGRRTMSACGRSTDAVLVCFSIDWTGSLVNNAELARPELLYFCSTKLDIVATNKKDLRKDRRLQQNRWRPSGRQEGLAAERHFPVRGEKVTRQQ